MQLQEGFSALLQGGCGLEKPRAELSPAGPRGESEGGDQVGSGIGMMGRFHAWSPSWTGLRPHPALQAPAGVNLSTSFLQVGPEQTRGRGKEELSAHEPGISAGVQAAASSLCQQPAVCRDLGSVAVWDLGCVAQRGAPMLGCASPGPACRGLQPRTCPHPQGPFRAQRSARLAFRVRLLHHPTPGGGPERRLPLETSRGFSGRVPPQGESCQPRAVPGSPVLSGHIRCVRAETRVVGPRRLAASRPAGTRRLLRGRCCTPGCTAWGSGRETNLL